MIRLGNLLLWVPKRIRHEFQTRGGDVKFLMWISFLTAFIWARLWITVFNKHAPNLTYHDEFQFGERVVIAGYHPHHIATGVLLVAIAGWFALHYTGKTLHRIAAVCYGVGLGLIVDEIGFIVGGITYPDDHAEVFVIAVIIAGAMMSMVYFPAFWETLERAIQRTWLRQAHRLRSGQRAPRRSPGEVRSEGEPKADVEPVEPKR